MIGHVDAGKSTLIGHLLYELGRLDEKTKVANERASNKIGKGSFSWAWNLDGTIEERERSVCQVTNVETEQTNFPEALLWTLLCNPCPHLIDK